MLGLGVTVAVVGFVAGAVAPLLVPGRRHMPVVVTIVLGLLGAMVGGGLGYAVLGGPGGAMGSVVGAAVVLLLFVAFGRRPTEDG